MSSESGHVINHCGMWDAIRRKYGDGAEGQFRSLVMDEGQRVFNSFFSGEEMSWAGILSGIKLASIGLASMASQICGELFEQARELDLDGLVEEVKSNVSSKLTEPKGMPAWEDAFEVVMAASREVVDATLAGRRPRRCLNWRLEALIQTVGRDTLDAGASQIAKDIHLDLSVFANTVFVPPQDEQEECLTNDGRDWRAIAEEGTIIALAMLTGSRQSTATGELRFFATLVARGAVEAIANDVAEENEENLDSICSHASSAHISGC
jgi:hypothetical protein